MKPEGRLLEMGKWERGGKEKEVKKLKMTKIFSKHVPVLPNKHYSLQKLAPKLISLTTFGI